MSKKLFGTDGIRGIANIKLTPELALSLGAAAGAWIVKEGLPLKAVVGRDTRKSGTMLGAALAAGLNSAGIDVTTLAVAPTGAISWVARNQGFSLAVVISASHNPAPDNGIKLISSTGSKVADSDEAWIESQMGQLFERPTGSSVGQIIADRSGLDAYMNWLETLVPERLEGLTIAVDAANGAACELGPEIFRRLGARVISTGTAPDGMNINEQGGATKPETVQKLTEDSHADLGIAFDGDADRAVFSDHLGRLVNGDRTMAIWSSHWRDQLEPRVVVGTVMSNMGFEAYLTEQGIELVRAAVGDKYVSQELRKLSGKVGGEQSGHIIFPAHGPTGDGLVTALELARVIKREGRPLANFYEDFANWPQLLVNVEVGTKEGWETHPELQGAIKTAEGNLVGQGRINVRPSGTQPIIRVMVEADDPDLRDREAERVVGAMLAAQGGRIYSRVDLTHALGD